MKPEAPVSVPRLQLMTFIFACALAVTASAAEYGAPAITTILAAAAVLFGPGILLLSPLIGWRHVWRPEHFATIVLLGPSLFFSVYIISLVNDLAGLPISAHFMSVTAASFLLLGLLGTFCKATMPELPRAGTEALATPVNRAYLLILLVVFVTGLIFLHPGIQKSSHGYYHSGAISQIINGLWPPNDPGAAGEPLVSYLFFYRYSATIGDAFDLSAFQVSIILRVQAFACLLFGAFLLIRQLLPTVTLWYLALFVLVGASPFAPVIFAIRAFQDGSLGERAQGLASARGLLRMGGIDGVDIRLNSIFDKFLNFTSYNLALSMMVAMLVLATLRNRSTERIRLFLLFMAGVTAQVVHPAFSLPIVLCLGASLAIIRSTSGNFATLRSELASLGLAIFISLPSTRSSVALGTDALSAENSGLFGVLVNSLEQFLYNLSGIGWAFGPAIIGFLIARRWVKSTTGDAARLVFTFFVLLLIGAAISDLPGRNEYKFILAGSIPAGILAAWYLEQIVGQYEKFAKVISFALLALALSHIAIYSHEVHFTNAWDQVPRVSLESRNGRLVSTDDNADFFDFIRNSTEQRAVIVMPVFRADNARVPPLHTNYSYLTALTGRRLYVSRGFYVNSASRLRQLDLVRQLYGVGQNNWLDDELAKYNYPGSNELDKCRLLESIRQGLEGTPPIYVVAPQGKRQGTLLADDLSCLEELPGSSRMRIYRLAPTPRN